MTIHDFDMARFVTGSEVVEVYARGAVRIDPAFGDAGDVDTAVVMLTHENGCFTTIDNSRQAVYGYDQRVEIFGSDGVASSENPLAHTGVVRSATGTAAATLPYFYLERYTPSYVHEWEAFVAAVSSGKTPPVTTSDARPPLAIGLAAWQSVREGRPVRIEEVETV
jgi:myo-inositol 2-dehydrogenase/D-chiro-inositol 1-dehydrogenase